MTTKHARDMTDADYAAARATLDDFEPLEAQFRREDEAERLAAAPPPAPPTPKRVADMTESEYAAAKAALED